MHTTTAPVPPREIAGLPYEIPESLDELILACLAKDPRERPAHIDEVASRLGAIADEHEAERFQVSLERRSAQMEEIEPTQIHDVSGVRDSALLRDDPLAPPPSGPAASMRLPAIGARPRRWVVAIVAIGIAAIIAIIALLVVPRHAPTPSSTVAERV